MQILIWIGIIVILGGLFGLWRLRHAYIHKKTTLLSQFPDDNESYFRHVFDSAAEGMALVSPRGHFLKVNHALCQMLGLTEEELLKINFQNIIHPDDFKKDVPLFRDMLNGKIKKYQAEQRYFHKNGEIMWMRVGVSLVRDKKDRPYYFIAQLSNITSDKKTHDQLRFMAYHDALTGLANRNTLGQEIHMVLEHAHKQKSIVALLLLDLDNFKNINDNIGHDSGDELLQIVAERLKSAVRVSDLVVRLGGDEFVVVVDNIHQPEIAGQLAQKILNKLLKPLEIKGYEVYITTSLGISIFPADGDTITDLMKNADIALYRAKELGKNNYQYYVSDMTKKANKKINRQNALSYALVKEEFSLCYQPIMNVMDGRITSIEAILRWNNKEYGIMTPEDTLLLAEENELTIPLIEWTLRTACKQVKAWQNKSVLTLPVAVKITPQYFKQSNFVNTVLQVIKDIKIPEQLLELEISESILMQSVEYSVDILKSLRSLGIHVTIDDFGKGFSSAAYLHRFLVDKIKFDKSFLQKVVSGNSNPMLIAMMEITKKLGIKTVVKGVETGAHYNFLKSEGCTEIQGFYISMPLDAEQIVQYVKKTVV